MNHDRRKLLKSAGLAGLLSGGAVLNGCDEQTSPEAPRAPDLIDQTTLAEAEKLLSLKYTNEERAQILEGIDDDLAQLAALRKAALPNDLPPAQVFAAKLPRKKVRSQKNELSVAYARDLPPPQSEDDVAFATLHQLGAWLRTPALTSSEVTEIYLKRIARFDGDLKSFVTVTEETARRQAQKADDDFSRGVDRGPLHGIPYGLKDLFDTKDIETTWGAAPFQGRIPDRDARVVEKLRKAGAVLLGKTACGALAYGDLWFGGRTRNPWNKAEGSSGSSAGSASAVVAGLCGFTIGTETLGSIISPSERCGAAGLRPTFGRVSRRGAMALCWSLDKVGPICRHAEDTALVLSAISGFDTDDPGSTRYGFAYGADDLSAVRIGFDPRAFEKADPVDHKALTALRSIGFNLVEVGWPSLDVSPLLQVVEIEAAAAFADLTLSDKDDALTWQAAAAWPNTWRRARFRSAVDLVQLDRLRRALMIEMAGVFDTVDVIVGPHFANDALLATNFSGHPQLAIPAGYAQTHNRTRFDGAPSPEGAPTEKTPRGVSLWADIFNEGPMIAVGAALEKELGVATHRPPSFAL